MRNLYFVKTFSNGFAISLTLLTYLKRSLPASDIFFSTLLWVPISTCESVYRAISMPLVAPPPPVLITMIETHTKLWDFIVWREFPIYYVLFVMWWPSHYTSYAILRCRSSRSSPESYIAYFEINQADSQNIVRREGKDGFIFVIWNYDDVVLIVLHISSD